MSYTYISTQYDPPAPALPVTLRPPGDSTRQVTTVGLVDTGADMVCCPEDLLSVLGAHPASSRSIFGVARTFIGRCNTYFMEFEIRGIKKLVETASVGNELILGRNLINEFCLTLDGPAKRLTVQGNDP